MKSAAERALILSKVSIRLHGHPLFAPLDLSVNPGAAVTVMGSSGCGKCTLLNYLCGNLPPVFQAEGAVRLNGRKLGGLSPEQR